VDTTWGSFETTAFLPGLSVTRLVSLVAMHYATSAKMATRYSVEDCRNRRSVITVSRDSNIWP
jgi:hypothetical protein